MVRFTLASIRPTAATQLYLETGGNLRKVQQFLQHAHLRTTVKYLLNHITEPFNARAIQKAQERMIERVTVVPEQRALGVERLDLPKARALKIVAGQFDTGCGTCRDPYDSPQPGEEKGRACTSFHACFSCPNGLWFLEDLPQVIATRDRLVVIENRDEAGRVAGGLWGQRAHHRRADHCRVSTRAYQGRRINSEKTSIGDRSLWRREF